MRKGFLLGGANFSGALLSLVRNIIIARLLLPEEFGIASTFAIILTLFEMVSDLGVNSLIVQARDGNELSFQASLQSIQLARGLLGALVLLVFAAPYARFLGVTDATWAFQVIAIVPLLRGFWHLDIYRLQRAKKFGAFSIATVSSQLLAVGAVWPLAQITSDYQIMLWSILLQQASFALMSHLLAERRYQIGWDTVVLRRTVTFGLPLLGNGVLLFGIFHGDRLIIANQMGMEVLGWFNVAVILTLTPSQILNKTLSHLMLPELSSHQDDRTCFAKAAAETFEYCLFAGVALAVIFALFGAPALLLLFGDKYSPALDILIWLSVMQAVRLAKAGPNIVATSKAATTNPLYANLARCAVLPFAFGVLAAGAPVVALVWLAILGEILAVAASLALLQFRFGVPLHCGLRPSVAAAAMLSIVVLEAVLAQPSTASAFSFRIGHVVLITGFVLFSFALPTVRARIRAFLRA